MTPGFHVDRIERRHPAGGREVVDVHVRYDGGVRVFTFPSSYPNATILTLVRIELRKAAHEANVDARVKALLGGHDL